MAESLARIGEIAVDSGTISVGDPCYLTGFVQGAVAEGSDPWEAYCGWLWRDPDGRIREPMGRWRGLHVVTPWGDGVYPVYAELDPETGAARRVVVDLDPGEGS